MPGKFERLKNKILLLNRYFYPLIIQYNQLKERGLLEEKYAKELEKEMFHLAEKVEFYILAICFILSLNIFSAMFVEFANYPNEFQFFGGLALLGNVLIVWLLGFSFVKNLFFVKIKIGKEVFLPEEINSKKLKKVVKFIEKNLSKFYDGLWLIFGIFAIMFFYVKVNAQFTEAIYCKPKLIFYFIVILIIFFIYCDGKQVLNQIRNAIGAFTDTKITFKDASQNINSVL